MSKLTEQLKNKWQNLELEALALMSAKDEALENVHAKYDEKLRAANVKASEAQKEYLDADAAAALVGRPDAEEVAKTLGLTLPADE